MLRRQCEPSASDGRVGHQRALGEREPCRDEHSLHSGRTLQDGRPRGRIGRRGQKSAGRASLGQVLQDGLGLVEYEIAVLEHGRLVEFCAEPERLAHALGRPLAAHALEAVLSTSRRARNTRDARS